MAQSPGLCPAEAALFLILGCYRWALASMWAAVTLTLPSDNRQGPAWKRTQCKRPRVKTADTGRRKQFPGKWASLLRSAPPSLGIPPTTTSSRRSAFKRAVLPAPSHPKKKVEDCDAFCCLQQRCWGKRSLQVPPAAFPPSSELM